MMSIMATPQVLAVLLPDGRSENWSIELETVSPHDSYLMTLEASDGRRWTSEAPDVFGCLLDVRAQVEPDGVLLCCNGARRDAWASGMQRDMGQGRVVYLHEGIDPGQFPPMVETLDPAPPDTVATVAEQRAWFESWWQNRDEAT